MTAVEARYRACGFSRRLVRALIAAGYEDPRWLLMASRRELLLIVNVGQKGLAEIEAYRARHGVAWDAGRA
jgi:hypothetical protein